MSKKYFVGQYVNTMRDVAIAALCADLNAIFIGPPGTGKSDITTSILDSIYKRENYGYIEIEPTIPTDEIKGSYDFDKLVKESTIERNQAGTITDPNHKAIVIDELGRARDEIWDLLMFILNPRDKADARPTISTANTMPAAERQEAMLDRIALWLWVVPEGVSAVDISLAQMQANGDRLSVPGKLPKAAEINKAKKAKPTEASMKAVGKVVAQLESEGIEQGITLNQRSIVQITRLLFHASVYFSGTNDFTSIPAEVMSILRYCYPAIEQSDQTVWHQIVEACGGIGFVITKLLSEVATVANEVSAIEDAGQRTARIPEIVTLVQGKLSELNVLGESADADDAPLIEDAKKKMNEWTGLAAQGKPIE